MEELKFPGEPCNSANVLKCEFHILACESRCNQRANEAERVIDPALGKSHTKRGNTQYTM